jgi:glutamine amidotransferase
MRVVVCDVGLGNLRSVERALAASVPAKALEIEVTRDIGRVRRADRLVMPGQGAFGDCARALDEGLGDAVREHIRLGRPYLGICLGLQVLFAASEEAPGRTGLGILDGAVVKLRGGVDATTGGPLKVPHAGWNVATPTHNAGAFGANTTQDADAFGANTAQDAGAFGAARAGAGAWSILPREPTYFYFVHSFVVVPKDASLVAATTDYGERFVSAVAKDNIFACQFHPEKSQRAGLALLARFLAS